MRRGFAILWLPVNRDRPMMPARIDSEIRRTFYLGLGALAAFVAPVHGFPEGFVDGAIQLDFVGDLS